MNLPTRHNPLDTLNDDEDNDVQVPPHQRKPMLSKEEAERIARSQGFAPPGAAASSQLTPAAESPAKPTPVSDVPRTLRKRKEPITVTVDPVILADFDKHAVARGLSRAAALGLAMQDWVASERKRTRE